MLLTFLVFLVILSVLILIHEFGHFILAKRYGIKVEEFALGLPFSRPLWSKKNKDGMIVAIYPFLFGGFVRLLGEDDDSAKIRKNPKSFAHKPWKVRSAILLGGVMMNFLLAVVLLYFYLSLSGFKTFLPEFVKYQFHGASQKSRVLVVDVEKNTPGKLSGLSPGDIIVAADGQEVNTNTLSSLMKEKAGSITKLTVYHQVPLQPKTISIIPRISPPKGEGPLGIAISDVIEVSYPKITQKLTSGFSLAFDFGIYTIKILGVLIGRSFSAHTAEPIVSNLSGPVGILDQINSLLSFGGMEALLNIIQLVSVMTINLAIVNVLPFPAMDGGRLFFVVAEGVIGKKMKPKWERYIHNVGFALLLALMVFITYNDIGKILTRIFSK